MTTSAHGALQDDIRPGEVRVDFPTRADASVLFIGSIQTPWRERRACPRRGDLAGPTCRIVVDDPWRPALQGLVAGGRAQILYWMHQARRDLVLQAPGGGERLVGTFALRSPIRPNPVAASIVAIEAVHPDGLTVRGLDCLDGTPLIDIKPEACPLWSPASA